MHSDEVGFASCALIEQNNGSMENGINFIIS